jgi:tetratricopeptide (TPR) repeat protein
MNAVIAACAMLLGPFDDGAASAARTQAIWDAAYNRMNQQIDVWFDDGDFPRATTLLKVQYELWPSDYEVATNLGWMHQNMQEWEDAQVVYRRYIAENPNDPDRALPMMTYHFQRRQFAEIIPWGEKYLSDKSHANMFRLLATSYERTGKLTESRAVWERYLKRAPNDGAAKRNLERVQKKISETRTSV